MLLEMELAISDIDVQHAVQFVVGNHDRDLFIVTKEVELRLFYQAFVE